MPKFFFFLLPKPKKLIFFFFFSLPKKKKNKDIFGSSSKAAPNTGLPWLPAWSTSAMRLKLPRNLSHNYFYKKCAIRPVRDPNFCFQCLLFLVRCWIFICVRKKKKNFFGDFFFFFLIGKIGYSCMKRVLGDAISALVEQKLLENDR
jgi:hypothetical protein